jgi:hypothetical protein
MRSRPFSPRTNMYLVVEKLITVLSAFFVKHEKQPS